MDEPEDYQGPLKIDGFDKAIIGEVCNGQLPLLIYDRAKIIEILNKDQCMDLDEAEEYFWFNIAGAYMGSGTPIIAWLNLEEYEDAVN